VVGRVGATGLTEDSGGASVPECCGQCVAELVVVVLEPLDLDAVGRGLQAPQQ